MATATRIGSRGIGTSPRRCSTLSQELDGRVEHEAEQEHDHAGDPGQTGLVADRRQHGAGREPVAAAHHDPRRRGPDAAGDVLGEHRDDVCRDRLPVADPVAELVQDDPPADDEHEVVDGDDDEARRHPPQVQRLELLSDRIPVPDDLSQEEEAEHDQRDDLHHVEAVPPYPRVVQSLRHVHPQDCIS
jgi:hypothetical protein